MKSLILLFLYAPLSVLGLSAMDPSISRARLSQAFSSPSGKLTFSPELVIPEPKDPTSILLLSSAMKGLSGKIRAAKANAVFLEGSLTALKSFAVEQESAKGNFPGPVPVVFCGQPNSEFSMADVAETGAEGVLVQVCCGADIVNAGDLNADIWVQQCLQALQCGIQPIPEVTIPNDAAQNWDEECVTSVVDKVLELMGSEPVAIVLSVKADAVPEDDATEVEVNLPRVPKALIKKIPIIASVKMPAGDGRLATEANRVKAAGFLGVFLRRDCIPGFRVMLDLDIVGKFWAGCIADLKSTRSKAFSFRSKNNMQKSAATQWGNYQKSVVESGALGDPNESYSVVDSEAGEYKGFA